MYIHIPSRRGNQQAGHRKHPQVSAPHLTTKLQRMTERKNSHVGTGVEMNQTRKPTQVKERKETPTPKRQNRGDETPKRPKPRSTNTNQQGFKGRSNRHLGNWRSMEGWLQTTRPLKTQQKGAPNNTDRNATRRGEKKKTGLGTQEGAGECQAPGPDNPRSHGQSRGNPRRIRHPGKGRGMPSPQPADPPQGDNRNEAADLHLISATTKPHCTIPELVPRSWRRLPAENLRGILTQSRRPASRITLFTLSASSNATLNSPASSVEAKTKATC